MTTALRILVATAVLCLALPPSHVPLHARQVGPGAIAGNREHAPAATDAARRGARARRNLVENLLPFAIAILAARAIGVSDTLTLAGAWLFLGARVVHGLACLAGVVGTQRH